MSNFFEKYAQDFSSFEDGTNHSETKFLELMEKHIKILSNDQIKILLEYHSEIITSMKKDIIKYEREANYKKNTHSKDVLLKRAQRLKKSVAVNEVALAYLKSKK